MANSVASPALVSDNNPAISSLKIWLSSSVPRYLSASTLFSILVIILSVVLTPTSEETRISSKLSKTSSSTFDFPATALVNLEKKEVFVFSRPLSNVSFASWLRLESFFSEENIFLKKLIEFYGLEFTFVNLNKKNQLKTTHY